MCSLIADRLKEIGMTTNQLSGLSGVKNSHLSQIKDGIIQKPGRRILIRIGLALSWGIDGIDRLLAAYGHLTLAESDVSYFIEAIDNRLFKSGYNAIHPGGFNFEIAIMSIEKQPGDVKLVTPIPHIIFRDFADYFSTDLVPVTEKENPVYREIREFLFRHRRNAFYKNLENHKLHHIMCRDCFESYIQTKVQKTSAKQMAQEFDRICEAISHENYDFKLTEKCSCFKFHIREPVSDKDSPTVIFAGSPQHPSPLQSLNDDTGALIGFISDAKELYSYFSVEFERLKASFIPESRDKRLMMEYIAGLLKKHNIKN